MSSEMPPTETYFSALREVADRFEHCVTVSALHLPDQPLVFVNSQFERNTGYTADECLGRNCRFLQGNLSHQPARAMIAAGIAARRSSFTDIINFRKDGTPFVNRLLLLPFEYLSSGEVQYFIGIQRVIGGADEAADLTRSAHSELEPEINNPLNIALASADSGLPDYQRIDEAITRIANYVDSLGETQKV